MLLDRFAVHKVMVIFHYLALTDTERNQTIILGDKEAIVWRAIFLAPPADPESPSQCQSGRVHQTVDETTT